MTTLDLESELDVRATSVRVDGDELIVEFEDGRTLIAPVAWYPRLQAGNAKERQKFEFGVMGIHWSDLDEDISYRGLLLGRRSGESAGSLKFWLEARQKGKKATLDDYSKFLKKAKAKK